MTRPVAAAALLAAAGLGAGAPAEEPNTNAAPRAVFSASRRFAVKGLPSADALALALAAEDAAGRLESFLGQPIPFSRNQPIVLAARSDAAAPGRAVGIQGWTDRGLVQKLEITNVERLDQEDLLEALCGLLVNRYLAARQPSSARHAALAEAPAWLSVGLAQNLYPSLRARNGRLALKRWEEGAPLSVSDLLALRFLPAGRWSEKAFCGVFADWLFSSPADPGLWDRMVDALIESPSMAASGLARIVLQQDDSREVEKHWELWLARQAQVRRIGERSAADTLAEFEARLTARPGEWPEISARHLPESLTMEELIPYRAEPWLPAVALRLQVGLGTQGFGLDAGLRRVRDLYLAYLSALAPGRPPGLFGWLRSSRPGEARLRELLRAADEALAAYKEEQRDRARFVDAAEAEFSPKAAEPGAMEREWPRAEMQRFVDEASREAPR
ncbi:MAG TPA: hypothetical protein P5327_11965 [Kiritimatiellia bacterium]|nr:hypothetical protein [Kiritimatiellia bacterium]